MTAAVRPLLSARAEPAVALVPAMASLFVFAAALATGVPTAMACLLLPLTAVAVWSNSRALEGSHFMLAYVGLLTLKLVLLVYQVQYRNLPLSGVDWVHYDRFGAELAATTGGDVWAMLMSPDWDLFTRFTAVTYTLFGNNSQQMYFLVFLTSLVTFTYIFMAAKLLLRDDRGATLVAMLFMMWPNEVVLSVTFLREMPIQMLVAASLYHFIRFWQDNRLLHLLVALTFSLGATLMHSGMIVLPIAFGYLASRDKSRGGLQPFRTAVFFAAIVVLLQSPLADPLTSKFGEFASNPGALVEQGQAPTREALEATTSYVSTDMSSVPLRQLPYRLAMFAFSPLPWQATNVGTAISVLIEGLPRLIMVALLALCWVRCRSGEPRRDVLLLGLLLTVLAGYVVFSLGVSSYGSAIRHRAKFFPIEIVLAYAAFAAGSRRRARPAPLHRRRNPVEMGAPT